MTFEPFMRITITKEHTSLGTELKFSRIVGSKIRLAGAPKRAKKRVIRFLTKETFIWCFIDNDLGWQAINEENGSKECFIPKFKRHGGVSE